MNAMASHCPLLPEWHIDTWLNAPAPLTLVSLRGRVVLLHAFQMLCPACVLYGLPQAERVRRAFPESELAVVGLHTVFEHHAVMTVAALRAFASEYRWSFPIGVDQADGKGGLSMTMARYGLRGTPSCLVLDHEGRVCLQHFGEISDLALGALLGRLIAKAAIRCSADEVLMAAAPDVRAAPVACLSTGCLNVPGAGESGDKVSAGASHE